MHFFILKCAISFLASDLFVHQKSLKPMFKTGVSMNNNYLNLFGQIENSKWILFSRITGVEFGDLKNFDIQIYCTLRNFKTYKK